MSRNLAALLILIIAVAAWLMTRDDDPASNAKVACEAAIERATHYDLSINEVASGQYARDGNVSAVEFRLSREGRERVARCDFDEGHIRQITLDGRIMR